MVTREDVLSAFQFRHATKKFDETKKISDQDFNVILEAGRLSPSSFGFEPWRFVVIQNTQLRNELRTVTWGAQGQLPTASHYVAILCLKDGMRYDSSHVTHMIARHPASFSGNDGKMKRERFRGIPEGKRYSGNTESLVRLGGETVIYCIGQHDDRCGIAGYRFMCHRGRKYVGY